MIEMEKLFPSQQLTNQPSDEGKIEKKLLTMIQLH